MERLNNAGHPSAASATPMVVQDAGMTGKSCHREPTAPMASPAQEQAAARSRDRMASYAPLRSNESAGQARRRVEAVVDRMLDTQPSRDDPNGSYTGVPMEPGEKPIQDADDL